MDLFKKKKRVIEVGGQKIELEPKPRKGLFGSFGKDKKEAAQEQQLQQPKMPRVPEIVLVQKQKREEKPSTPWGGALKPEAQAPVSQQAQPAAQQQPSQPAQQREPGAVGKQKKGFLLFGKKKEESAITMPQQRIEVPKLEVPQKPIQAPKPRKQAAGGSPQKPGALDEYFKKVAVKQKGLEAALREEGIETSVRDFVKRMFFSALLSSIVLAIVLYLVLTGIGLTVAEGAIFAVLLAVAIFQGAYRSFLQYPVVRAKRSSRNVEKDILFAAREVIISLRSGMPLYDAIKSVSTGYGDASIEFSRIVDKVRFGAPLEEAIDSSIAASKSPSFRRIMLQASVSIKAGADVISALQGVLDQLSQERVIEMRSYGQKLNAIAMFYMLFGVILPSMGIAVVTILTTFISIFSVTTSVLAMILVVIFLLQIVFLRLIIRSRPIFTM